MNPSSDLIPEHASRSSDQLTIASRTTPDVIDTKVIKLALISRFIGIELSEQIRTFAALKWWARTGFHIDLKQELIYGNPFKYSTGVARTNVISDPHHSCTDCFCAVNSARATRDVYCKSHMRHYMEKVCAKKRTW